MSNWFTRFFGWIFGSEEEEGHDESWRNAFAKYDPTFRGKIKELYEKAAGADEFFSGLEDIQLSLEIKIKEREQEKADIDKEIYEAQEKVKSGTLPKTEEEQLLRRVERVLKQAERAARETFELDTQYKMLMDFVMWLDEIVREPEISVNIDAQVWEKLRDGVRERRSEFEAGRVAYREAVKQMDTSAPQAALDETKQKLLAYGEKPVEEEAPAAKDEKIVESKLAEKEPEREALQQQAEPEPPEKKAEEEPAEGDAEPA